MKIDAYTIPGTERETVLSADQLLKSMDAAGVSKAVIAPEDRELAWANEQGNQRLLRLAEKSNGRFIPACCTSPWQKDGGAGLLQRSVRDGARMLVLAPALQGFILGDDVCDTLLRAAAGCKLPVYVHTGPHSHSVPTQLVLLAARHPDTRFICGHCGVTDYSMDMPAVFRQAPSNIWFELSFVRPWAISGYGQDLPDSRLIFGSSAPRNDLVFEFAHFDRHWPAVSHPGTYGRTIERLLGEVRP